MVFAEKALALDPASEVSLAALLKSLSDSPERVLDYSGLVVGGGVCRYRLARAELELNLSEHPSIDWLEEAFSGGADTVAADAACWLSILYRDEGTDRIQRAVELVPGETFYRGLYTEKLIAASMVEDAADQLKLLAKAGARDFFFWRTASSFYTATGDTLCAIEASRRAYNLRRTPSSAADLAWKLYFCGRGMVRRGMMAEAEPFLRESSSLWSRDSLWSVKSDSLLNLVNRFTGTTRGYGAPF